jgi:hypothetical protein
MNECSAAGELKIVPMMHCERAGFLPTDLPFGVSMENLPELMRVLRPLPCAICGGKHAISIPLGRLPATTTKVVLRVRFQNNDEVIHTRQTGWVECDRGGNLVLYMEGAREPAEELRQTRIKDWWFEAVAAA